MDIFHVDVFSSQALSGNGLTVILNNEELDVPFMLRVAKEFKQFETIFIYQTGDKRFRGRIFTVEEELDFAGHPVIGAASIIHEKLYSADKSVSLVFKLNNKSLQVESVKRDGYYQAIMNQGVPEFLGIVKGELIQKYLCALNLNEKNLYPSLPMEVISTGLAYLIVPLASGLDQARISTSQFERQLSQSKAKFVYVFDIDRKEGRTWDNLGTVEDVATGSAAGPVYAYLNKWKAHGIAESIVINQGRYVGRPSRIEVSSDPCTGEVKVSGNVKIIVRGNLLL